NTWDSLGEAYAAAGKKTEAIENYEKSLKLNPNSESGKTALAKLKQ
ncbi:MAG: tetratricopeptide repeat protein, partial [Bacteroidetes bacterium]